MENKYYTPSIDEIYHGFEFEYIHPMSEYGKTNGWIPHNWEARLATLTINPDHISIGGFAIKTENIRVKYLDSSDIESFGFIFKDKCQWEIPFTYSFNEMGIGEVKNVKGGWKLIYTKDGYCSIVKDCYGETSHFRGTIKNKSELSRLLKQLSII